MAEVREMAAGGSSELIGREQELARADHALDELAAGRSVVLAVVGEPGIGKTRLLGELAARAEMRGFSVFAGRGAESARSYPFGVLVDALDAHLGSIGVDDLPGLSPHEVGLLARVFPALEAIAPDRAPAMPQAERYRFHHAIAALVDSLGHVGPCVLALDDLHWADEASLELVAHLLRHRRPSPVLVALAFRPAQASPLLATALELLDADGALLRSELAPLSVAEAERFLGEDIPPHKREALLRESGGNPFYLSELVRALPDAVPDLPANAVEGLAGVPRTVQDALRSELARLSDDERSLAQAASVVGEPVEVELAAAAAQMPVPHALTVLDALLARDLLRGAGAPRAFRFRHPLVRRGVYESAALGWRIGAHGRVASALAERGAAPVARAYHVEQSAPPGDRDAVEVLVAAGDAAANAAPAAAAHWYEAALRLLGDDRQNEPRHLELLVALARALGSSGEIEASRDALQQMLNLVGQDNAPLRAQVVSFMAMMEQLLGHHGEARSILQRALDELPDPNSGEAAALQFELAVDEFFSGLWEQVLARSERSHELARSLGELPLAVAALSLRGIAFYGLSQLPQARASLAEASELLDRITDSELAIRLVACHWVGWLGQYLESYEASLRHLTRGLAIARDTGQDHLLVPLHAGLVVALAERGRLCEAEEHANAAFEIARLSGSSELRSWALTVHCEVALRTGELAAAIRYGEEGAALAAPIPGNHFAATVAGWLSEARIELGEVERGRGELLAAMGGPELKAIQLGERPYFYEILTRADIALGRLEEASDWASQAEDAAAGLALPGRTSQALRARAAVSLAQGRAVQAASLARESAAVAGDDRPLDRAQGRLLAGKALAAAGDQDAAIAELRLAHDEFDTCGARRDRDRAANELRRLGTRLAGSGRRGSGTRGVAALSKRELEVAELVQERLTNREIAQALVISEKTVERHLSRMFEKLEVSSRRDLARVIQTNGIPS